MRILLDTHTFIWYANAPERLPAALHEHITDGLNDIFVSIATAWEMTVKSSIGRLSLSSPPYQLVADQLRTNHYELLDIKLTDLQILQSLPFHHRDPFDRVLVAQAIGNQLKLASIDDALDAYPIDRVWQAASFRQS